MSQKGFIQIPLFLAVIITSIVVSAGTATVLYNQRGINTFIASVSNFLNGAKDAIIEKNVAPQEIGQELGEIENQNKEVQAVFEPTISDVGTPDQNIVVIQERVEKITENNNSPTTELTPEPTPTTNPELVHLTPPEISSITVSNIKAYSATISWITDEPSTSVVAYDLTAYFNRQGSLKNLTPIDSPLVLNHSIILSGLMPQQDYSFKVISTDAAGNQADSRTRMSTSFFTTKSSKPGSLYVSLSKDMPVAVIQIPKSLVSETVVTKITLRAEQEDICIYKIIMERIGGSVTDFETVSLWDEDVQLGSQTVMPDLPIVFNFIEDSCWIISSGQTKYLTIRAGFREIAGQDSYGAISGDNPKLCIQSQGISTEGVTSEGSVNILGLGHDICGDVILRKSQPIFNVGTLATTNLLSNSENTLYGWTITADPKNHISWKRIQFNISGLLNEQGVGRAPESTINQLKIYDVTKNSEIVGTVSSNLSPSDLVVTIETENEQVIFASSTTTYELRGVIPSVKSGSSISTSIKSKSKNIITANYDSIDSGSFIWSDRSATGHSEASSDWTNDYGVSGLPTATLSLSR